MPMATPMSAARSAGASLTPSPVIAPTTSWRAWSTVTIRSLCSGLTRATTLVRGRGPRLQGVVVHGVEITAGENAGPADADVVGHAARRPRVITGDHHDADARAVRLGDRRRRLAGAAGPSSRRPRPA